jgi:hypothetical protein
MLMVFAMSKPLARSGHVSIEELEAYRVFAAYIVSEFGEQYIGVLDRIEQELEKARREDPLARARRVLQEASGQAQMCEGKRLKAISSSQ